MKYVIIGGVAGGATAAARLRRQDETSDIVLIEKGKHISYANCGLPYYIGGVITDRDRLFVQTPEAFSRRFRIDVRTESEAMGINTETKVVIIKSAEDGTYSESYDKLLLAPGSSPVRPPLPALTTKASSRCATWMIPTASNSSSTTIPKVVRSLSVEASSDWRWLRT